MARDTAERTGVRFLQYPDLAPARRLANRPALRAPAGRGAGPATCAVNIQYKPERSDTVLAAVSAHDGIVIADRSMPGRATVSLSGRAGDDIVGTLPVAARGRLR